ncbi:MAG: hypothetical protein IPM54_41730 [Polyangiaceae bacterium]|nr:hypothetical protein [Polyangiaceae bacterium]
MGKLPRTLGSAIKLLTACTLLGACTSYSTMCVDEMDCRDGNDADVDACVIGYESQDDLASLHGCSDFWNRYIDCRVERSHCESSDIWTDDGDCSDEWDDYRDCVN